MGGFGVKIYLKVTKTARIDTVLLDIVVFAGNNENEAAVSTNWYNTNIRKDFYHGQYRDLYIATIRDEFLKTNMSRPFVSSSYGVSNV